MWQSTSVVIKTPMICDVMSHLQIFMEVTKSTEHKTLGEEIAGIVVSTLWASFTGICIGIGMGVFNQ